MKRKVTLLALLGICFSIANVNAQNQYEETAAAVYGSRVLGTYTKSGLKILPEAGDIAIGIDATPFFKYLGNSFNGNEDNDNTNFFSFDDDVFDAPGIYGKYFISDGMAIRMKLHVGFESHTDKEYVRDLSASADYDDMVEDKVTDKANGIGLRMGIEWRRGYGRLQGFVGPEVGLGMFSKSREWKYGNSLKNSYVSSRPTKQTSGTTFMAILGGFAGVEYFVAPKISVGGELGLAFKYTGTGDGKIKYDYTNDTAVNKDETKTGGENSAEFGTKYTGNIFVTFHF